MISQLIEIIGREASLFESFLTLLERQRQMLIENDHDGLVAVTEQQREKLVQSQVLNRSREQLIEKIKASNDIEGDLNVTRLLELTDQSQAERLTSLKGLIIGLHDQITEVRNQNALLLNQSREYISKMMEMLSKVNVPAGAYGPGAKETQRHSTLAVDRRV